MGSKRAMLLNGLGAVLDLELNGRKHFYDLFSGSSVVARHVSEKYSVKVVASDLQAYSQVLASAIITRLVELDFDAIWGVWHKAASDLLRDIDFPEFSGCLNENDIWTARAWGKEYSGESFVSAYCGYYFSPKQALWLDAFRQTVSMESAWADLAIASLIETASECAASPGHTAQPFQPSERSLPHIFSAWKKDVESRVKNRFGELNRRRGLVQGKAIIECAGSVARSVESGSIVFVDPPYSDVQYSRFYHVLESIALGSPGAVTGAGRYPDVNLRPKSAYSRKTESRSALENLLKELAEREADVVLTFPAYTCSNGLSGEAVIEIAANHFFVSRVSIASRFSTLGGGSLSTRAARQPAEELILVLKCA